MCSHDEQSISEKSFKHFIFFDNIENFIKGHQVYNKDINEIARIMHNFVDSITQRFNKLGFDFSQHFKIIMAIRDTTEKIIDEVYLQEDGHSRIQVDVSTWFSLDEILKNKLEYFVEKNIVPYSNEQSEIVKSIFSDTTYREGGIGDAISKMYNYNKRRITIYVTSVIELYPESARDYLMLWKRALEFERRFSISKLNKHKELTATYKNAARQTFLRILLDYIESTNYFEDINTIGVLGGKQLGSGFARKILTYMYRSSPTSAMDDEIGNLGYIGFNTLLRNVFISPCNQSNEREISSEMLEVISRIMCKMNSSSEEKTHWCQLISIKFNQEIFDEHILANEMLAEFKNNSDNCSYGVKITDAGRFFISNIIPSFEYFSCRYAKQSSPLFATSNLAITAKNKLYCRNIGTELLENIELKVTQCILDTVKFDSEFFAANNIINFDAMYSVAGCPRRYCFEPPSRNLANYGNEQCHPLRIINSHIRYLDNYRVFILTAIKENGKSFYDVETKEQLSKCVLDIIDKYIIILEKIVKNDIVGAHIKKNSSPYVGKDNVEREQKYVSIYKEKISLARRCPHDYSIRIERSKKNL